MAVHSKTAEGCSRQLVYFGLLLTVVGAAYLFFPVLQGEASLLASFDDDAFYYFKIASNIASGHGSTFNGIHETNGYHPLWLGLLSILWFVSAQIAVNPLVLVKLAIVILHAITIASFLKVISKLRASLSQLNSMAILALTSFFYIFISNGGMEVALLLPLIITLVYQIVSGQSASYIAVVFSFAVLTRLDSVIFLAPLMLLSMHDRSKSMSGLLPFIFIPVALILPYVIINLVFFNSLLPVSGLAKSSGSFVLFTSDLFSSLFSYTNWKRVNLFALVMIPVVFLAVFLKRSLSFSDKTGIALIIGAIIFYVATASRSDWPLWPWYFFPGYFVFFAGFLISSHRFKPLSLLNGVSMVAFMLVALTSCYLFIAMSGSVVSRINKSPINKESDEIVSFMDDNPGVYAMGDRAGIIGYRSSQPLIQVEGLVMDKHFIDALRSPSITMNQILDRYKVDYYINFQSPSYDGCFYGREPVFGKQHVVSTLCRPPIAVFESGARVFHVADGWQDSD